MRVATATSTSPSLLIRIRNTADHLAWRQFDARYGDLILRYCRNRGLRHCDAEDVRQTVMLALAKALPGFRYSPERGRFRSYLGQVVHRSILHFRHKARPHAGLRPLDDSVAVEVAPELEPDWMREWVNHHRRLAMRTVRATFEPRSVEIFDRLLAGESVQHLAATYGMSTGAVHKVKQRIRDRMTELIADQVRDEDGLGG